MSVEKLPNGSGVLLHADAAAERSKPNLKVPSPTSSPYARARDEQQDDSWPPEALHTPSSATEETRRFFNKMSSAASPAALRAMRITETELQEVGGTEPPKSVADFFTRLKQGLEETFLLARLAFRLLSLLGLGWRWNVQLWRLLLYALLLMPGFIQMGIFYMMSKRVLRSIPYGSNPRNRLDMYIPSNHWKNPDVCIPVVIYVTGGAWTIGYKAWGSLLGRRLSKNGVIVCCLDYRNFPQGTAIDMMEDVNAGISWVLTRIRHYGGDPERVFLVGQSCGAQLSMMCMLTQEEQMETAGRLPGALPRWNPKAIKGIIGISGVYNCHGLADHLHQRGLYRSLFDRIMSINGMTQLKLLSPTYCVKGSSWAGELPPILLLHGDADECAPIHNAEQFAEALQEAGASANLKRYVRQTHTSPLIENPMRGGRDRLTDDILAAVTDQDEVSTRQLPLCPSALIMLAAFVCPF